MTTHDIAELRKWLNEEPNRPIDRAALARVLAPRPAPAEGDRVRAALERFCDATACVPLPGQPVTTTMFQTLGMALSEARAVLDALPKVQPKGAAEAEVERLRGLAATCYAGLGAECDLPEQWLDALNAAANGEPFTTDGLLPFTSRQSPAVAPQDETAWLIEVAQSPTLYWDGSLHADKDRHRDEAYVIPNMQPDASKAVRFPTKQAAEKAFDSFYVKHVWPMPIRVLGRGYYRIAEHMWPTVFDVPVQHKEGA